MSARGEERKKTKENQMKGRRSDMEITSNRECMVSVLKTRWAMILQNVFCILPPWPSPKSACYRITDETS